MKEKIAVLTGAGVSAESGLGTYRDNGGLWDNYDPMEVASIEGWYRNRKLVLDFYNMQRAKLRDAQPNAAHLAIAALEDKYDVTVITQNVDNLHEKAGSTRVIHLHGEATKVRPENGVYDESYSEREVIDVGYEPVNLGDKAPNGSQLRPHIVFFGEAVPKIERAIDIVSAADLLLIVGTSMQVYPAAGLYRYADPKTPIYVIDPADMPLHDARITHIKEVATKGMEKFTKILEER
ncbi:MAG: NAD-dependent deacylase [Bacteroidales bacterium]|jgi:NAD-dependent deacetylase|nr:NAD-dependent deacylase [Bacteroidales bacterium]MBQ6291399.1 NAD-dependent deacylase [Bacteroidales bacterium]MBR4478587.1 NAD-dependent deacylase [Bacteroidales bacterium]MBR4568549.1 NAD-dependent deacylase [Bacteroidales bacterium]